jgi:hypothetical protein
MHRRDFLTNNSKAALGFCLLPLAGCVHGVRQSTGLKDSAPGEASIAELEQLIPKLMEENRVPGVSIALIKDANLVWRRGFGVKDGKSQEPVDNDTVFEAASVSKTVFAYAVLNALHQIKRHPRQKTEGRQKGSLTHGRKTPGNGVNAYESRGQRKLVAEGASPLRETES